MVFYLHMSGEGAGTLSVYTITKFSISLLLNLTGYQGNYWIRQEVPLFSKENFQVMFEGKMGGNGMGDISIDDITFSPGCLFNNDPKINLPDPPNVGMLLFCLLIFLFYLILFCVSSGRPPSFCSVNSDGINCGLPTFVVHINLK